ncbi:unnamed protein product [Prunus armeniaca]
MILTWSCSTPTWGWLGVGFHLNLELLHLDLEVLDLDLELLDPDFKSLNPDLELFDPDFKSKPDLLEGLIPTNRRT